jgi:hypothetical protein
MKKSFSQTSTPLYDKTSEEPRNRRIMLQHGKAVYDKTIANILQYGENLNNFLRSQE